MAWDFGSMFSSPWGNSDDFQFNYNPPAQDYTGGDFLNYSPPANDYSGGSNLNFNPPSNYNATPSYSAPTNNSGGGWGSLLSGAGNLASGLFSGLGGAKGIGGMLGTMIPLGLSAASAFSKPQQSKVTWQAPPVPQQVTQASQAAYDLAGSELPNTWAKTLDYLKNQNAMRGLQGNFNSGSFNKMVAEQYGQFMENMLPFRLNALQSSANMMNPYASQMVVQQPQESALQRGLGTYTDLVSQANLARAQSGGRSNWSWFPWSTLGGQ